MDTDEMRKQIEYSKEYDMKTLNDVHDLTLNKSVNKLSMIRI